MVVIFLLLFSILFQIFSLSTAALEDDLFHSFLPPSKAAEALVPPEILFIETPIAIRYSLIAGLAIYEPKAACHPTALSFFGVKDKIDPTLCDPNENAKVSSFTVYQSLKEEFPAGAQSYAKYLRSLGLEPESSSTDLTNPNGRANAFAKRITDFFHNDGWNSLGDKPGQSAKAPFKDYTGYVPVNPGELSATSLKFPLRWKPQTYVYTFGTYVHQAHVVPQLGKPGTVRPFFLTEDEINSRAAPPPYSNLKATSLSGSDRAKVESLVSETIEFSANLTPSQRFLANWWNNKLLSTAALSAYFEQEGNYTKFEIAHQFLGEMMAQHDALITVWREKRRWDSIRPRQMVRLLRQSKTFRAWTGNGVGTVSGDMWQPYVAESAHSEYPSASAALCQAALEHMDLYSTNKLGSTPRIKIRYPLNSLPFEMDGPQSVVFENVVEAQASCAQSRLWSGVHFSPALPAGTKIGKGVGKLAFEFIQDLLEGEVPERCWWCEGSSGKFSTNDDDD